MNFTLVAPSTWIPPKFPQISSFNKPPRTNTGGTFRPLPPQIPAHDRKIDLGKYRGQMLGSLPSSYLKWMSKNLRAGDTIELANLADEVLNDAVYRDRIEWEFAENVLNGNTLTDFSSSGKANYAVSELQEISERFGWDNDDKIGWSKVNFGLLGTSKGGRIPRVNGEIGGRNLNSEKKLGGDCGGGGARSERRERLKQKRIEKLGFGNGEDDDDEQNEGGDGDMVVPIKSPFPGRQKIQCRSEDCCFDKVEMQLFHH